MPRPFLSESIAPFTELLEDIVQAEYIHGTDRTITHESVNYGPLLKPGVIRSPVLENDNLPHPVPHFIRV
jgi:hypothetical protein